MCVADIRKIDILVLPSAEARARIFGEVGTFEASGVLGLPKLAVAGASGVMGLPKLAGSARAHNAHKVETADSYWMFKSAPLARISCISNFS
ncbi:hypothetical protein R1flu_000758 [Riccia fluitans]|uniref:Uncharacterized protein n=1 Tax=Riccia fluitans TaxID=41844 RepID=A0ABD1Y1J0_9MARC